MPHNKNILEEDKSSTGDTKSSDPSTHGQVPDGVKSTGMGESNAKKLKGLDTVIEKQTETINGLLNWAFQLANYFCVSQAVVFSALPGYTSSLKCHDLWFPWALSLLPGFLNLFALCVIGKKCIVDYALLDQNIRHREQLMRMMIIENEIIHEQRIEKDPALKRRLKIGFCLCIFSIVLLAIVIAFGSARILCLEKTIVVKHHDDDDDAKCLKLCDGGKCIRICTNH